MHVTEPNRHELGAAAAHRSVGRGTDGFGPVRATRGRNGLLVDSLYLRLDSAAPSIVRVFRT